MTTTTLSPAQRSLRANIRNAYFCESPEVILAELRSRLLSQDQHFEVLVLGELLAEVVADMVSIQGAAGRLGLALAILPPSIA